MIRTLPGLLIISILFTASVGQADLTGRLNFLLGRNPQLPGPNCWNSALVAHELLPNLRYTSPEELKLWLNSSYCRRITNPESLQEGDIVALRGREAGELHAMLWMDAENVFSKNTSHRLDPYEIQRAELILSSFRVTEKECLTTDSNHPESCQRWADYYRCTSPSLDRSRQEALDPQYAPLARQMRELNQDIETLAFSPNPQALPVAARIQEFRARLQEVNFLLQAAHLTADSFFWEALKAESASMAEQLRMMEHWLARALKN